MKWNGSHETLSHWSAMSGSHSIDLIFSHKRTTRSTKEWSLLFVKVHQPNLAPSPKNMSDQVPVCFMSVRTFSFSKKTDQKISTQSKKFLLTMLLESSCSSGHTRFPNTILSWHMIHLQHVLTYNSEINGIQAKCGLAKTSNICITLFRRRVLKNYITLRGFTNQLYCVPIIRTFSYICT